MAPRRGEPVTAWQLFWSSDLPLGERLSVAARNMLRRVTTAPHDCCGHPGEPGC